MPKNVDQVCETYAAAALYLATLMHTQQETLIKTRAGRRANVVWSIEVQQYANAIMELRIDEALCAEYDYVQHLNDQE